MGMTGNIVKVRKRIEWIDYAKAVAIFLVVIGHAGFDNGLKLWLYSFHMPLFFFLSGLTLPEHGEKSHPKYDARVQKIEDVDTVNNIKHNFMRKINGGGYIRKRAKLILIPYLAYALLHLIYNVLKVIFLDSDIHLFKAFLGIFVQLRGTEYTIGLWYLPLLFLVTIYVRWLIGLSNKKQIWIIWIICTLFIAAVLYSLSKMRLPWGLDVVPIAGFFLWCGYRYKVRFGLEKPLIEKGKAVIALIVAFLINLLAGFANVGYSGQMVDMHGMVYGNIFLYVLAALSGIVMVILLTQIWSRLQVSQFILAIGMNTLHIYCLHGIFLEIMRKVLGMVVTNQAMNQYSVLFQVAMSTMAVVGSIVIVYGVKYVGGRIENSLYRRKK